MKKWLVILFCTLGLLVVAMCPPPPDKPVCPEGQITVTESVWVDGYTTPGHWEVRDWVHTTYKQECKQVEVLTCPVIDGVTYNKSNDPNKCHRPSTSQLRDHPYHMTQQQAVAYTQNHPEWVNATVSYKEVCETVVDVPGHYTDWYDYTGGLHADWRYIKGQTVEGYYTAPVCRLPEVGEEVLVNCTGVYLVVTTEGIPAEPETLVLWSDSYTTETFLFKDVLYTEPSECLKTHCEVQGVMWYQCNSGAWLYGTGALRDCPWCGGLNGTRVVKESYDCGVTWYYYLNGVPVSAPPQPLGRYSCNTADCFGK